MWSPVFAITEVEVTAGDDVALAYALLRFGTPAELQRDPGSRLRLTVGLVQRGDRWRVTHEHHSFADTSDPNAQGSEDPPVEKR